MSTLIIDNEDDAYENSVMIMGRRIVCIHTYLYECFFQYMYLRIYVSMPLRM